MKDKKKIRLQFILTNPFEYYILLLFASIGGWKAGQDMFGVLNLNIQTPDSISTYSGLIAGTLIGFFILKKERQKSLKISQIPSKN